MLANCIAYVAVVSRDVALAADVLERALGMIRTNVSIAGRGAAIPVFAVGESALALFSPGDPFLNGNENTGVDHIALACASPTSAMAALREAHQRDRDSRGGPSPGTATGPDTGSATGPGLGGDASVEVPLGLTHGVRTRFTCALDIARGDGFVQRFDHLGIATEALDPTTEVFVERFGFPVESRQTDAEVEISVESFTSDRYGVVYHNRAPRRVGGGRVTFITVGDTELELLQPMDFEQDRVDHGRPGDTRQDMGALARFVTRRGSGLHHIALKVPDTNIALERIRSVGARTIDDVSRPGSRRAQIGFVHPSTLGGVLLHFGAREDPLRDVDATLPT
ncbi:MAG: methylmalonyl-CoA/ethylmalonyl-CoA epimerase [Gammaproteobacteria bacterium]|jgi:methylmalonyl-CoA/ethylmalonyl-CoA epimerase